MPTISSRTRLFIPPTTYFGTTFKTLVCFQPQCYAPCCVPGHVRLKEGLSFVNGNVVSKKELLKQRESEKMRVRRLLMSNISEEVDGLVSTYFGAAEDHDMFSGHNSEDMEDVDVYTWEDESWDEVLAAAENDSDEFYRDMHECGEDLDDKPSDLTPNARFYKSSSLPPGCRIVHEYFNGNLEVWYKSSDGTRFNSKEHLIEAHSSGSSLHSSDQNQTDPIKFVLSLNHINNNQSHNISISQGSENPRSSEILSLSFASTRTHPISIEGEASTSEKGQKSNEDPSSSVVLAPQTTRLPLKCKDEVVEKCPSAGNNKKSSRSPTTVRVFKDNLPQSRPRKKQDKCQPSTDKKRTTSKTNPVNGESSSNNLPNEESDPSQARCQPCNLKFPVEDITNHLMSHHSHEMTKLKSCTKCKDNVVLMTAHHLRKHRDLVHPDIEKPKTGRPRKDSKLSSTPKPAAKRKSKIVNTLPLNDSNFDLFTNSDEFHKSADFEPSLNDSTSSAENIDKINDFLSKTAPVQANESMVEHGEVVSKKKRGRPPISEADKKKRSRSLGGVKAKSSSKKRNNQGKKSKVSPSKNVFSDNDPRHATSSVNLRKKGRKHSHDSSKECNMNCSLSPDKFESMPVTKEYKVDSIQDSQKVSKSRTNAKVANNEEKEVFSVHAK